jgi:colanic acid biosynthesis glycosyl transferase WcaI
MKILIIAQYFWPENFNINEVAVFLKEKGHEVTVLTGQPNYPEGKFYPGYSFSNPKSELYNGIEIFRLPTIPRGKRNTFKLILNYLFFPFIGRFYWEHLLKNKSFDIVFVCQQSPVFVGLLGARIKKKLKIPMVMWVLDLWPESIYAVSSLNPFLVAMPLEYIVNRIYHSCEKIFVSSKSFFTSILKYDYKEKNIHYLPNWADGIVNKLSKEEIAALPAFPEGFKVLFAGNIGDAQDIETILEGAEILRENKQIKWIFLGEGRKRKWLETEIKKRNIGDQVFCYGRYPTTTMPHFFSQASVMLASLKKNPVFELTVPAKLQTYMASRKPIIALLSGEGNQIVQESNCGYGITSGDSKLLAETVHKMSTFSNNELEVLADNGFHYYQEHFDKDKLLNNLNTNLMSLINENKPG